MKKAQFKKYSILYHLLCIITVTYPKEMAVIAVPIADLVGQQMATIYSTSNTYNSYQALPVCGEKNASYSCPRLHQLLYNEIVDIVDKRNDEVCIKTSHAYYLAMPSTTKQSTYWTSDRNIRYLNDIINAGIDREHIPQPIDFEKRNLNISQSDTTITLKEPHYQKSIRLTFSAGTRFIAKKPFKKNAQKITVYAIDYKKNKETTISIPYNKCVLLSSVNTQEKQIKQYVTLLQQWAHRKDGFIPYVWGGCSFNHTINSSFTLATKKNNMPDCSWYEYDKDTTCPKSGLDCSGAIIRAAQISNIPYFCKNSATIDQCLKPLQTTAELINGDIILIKGHVMVVSNIDKNLLIEARAYSHGYGKLHEIALDKAFDGINNYNALCDAFFNKKTLYRKDRWGNIKDQYKNWKILKISSIYNNEK